MDERSDLAALDFPSFIARVERALAGPLPGLEGQMRMSPMPRPGWKAGRIPADATEAGGLLLLYPKNDRPHLVLTERSRDLPTHKGQVSLPGGMREPGESLMEAALREAEEEVGVARASLRVLGALTPLDIPVSGFVLHPFVAAAGSDPGAYAATGEVERVLEVPLAHLLDPARRGQDRRVLLQSVRDTRYFEVEGKRVWGATAMILGEFLTLLGAPP